MSESADPAQVVIPCEDLDATASFFVEVLGFRVAAVFPADAPRVVVVQGHGLDLRLERGIGGDPGRIRVPCQGSATDSLTAPNGTRVDRVPARPDVARPPLVPSRVFSRAGDDWSSGRAGMLYRDLLPDRLGGRFIVSRIRIPEGGPVPDWVHFHRVHVQLLFCLRGWVKVVYEGQGAAFVMNARDCVLQPPGIRHRVIEASAGFEIFELGSPAEHETIADFELELPNTRSEPTREWEGQGFVFHRSEGAAWASWERPGFEWCDTGIHAATGALASAGVVRRSGALAESPGAAQAHGNELEFSVVLAGSATLRSEGHRDERLGEDDSWCVPGAEPHALVDVSDDFEFFWVSVPKI